MFQINFFLGVEQFERLAVLVQRQETQSAGAAAFVVDVVVVRRCQIVACLGIGADADADADAASGGSPALGTVRKRRSIRRLR